MKTIRVLKLALAVLVSLSAFSTAATPAQAGSEMEISRRVTIGGEGPWGGLALDNQSRRLFIARGDRVMILNIDSGRLCGEIEGLLGASGITLVPEFNKGFISCTGDNVLRIFDLKTLEKTGHANTGRAPQAVVYDPSSSKVFVLNSGDGSASIIMAASGRLLGKLQLGAKPATAVADGKGRIYVGLQEKNEIAVIDANKEKVLEHWKLSEGKEPAGLSIDTAHKRLFVGCRNKLLLVLDLENGKQLSSFLPTGKGTASTLFDPATQNIYSANADDGTLTVIHENNPNSLLVLQDLQTEIGAATMALDSKLGQIWLVSAKPAKAGSGIFIPESFEALIVSKHIPVDEGIPFSRKYAAFLKRRQAGCSKRHELALNKH